MDESNRRPGLATGPWWRFSRYEIVNGVVRPTEDAYAEEYDPWQDYLENRRRGAGEGRVSAPYQDLIGVWRDVRGHDVDGSYGDLGLKQKKRLLRWCRQHGLLGLWHHEVLLALFPVGRGQPDGGPLRGYERAAWDWRERRLPRTRRGTGQERQGLRLPERLLDALPREVWRSALPSGGFVMRELASGAISNAPLDSLWRLYFDPDGPLGSPTWPVPPPTSIEFWRSYGEPVSMMMFAAQELASSIEHLTAPTGDKRGRFARERLNVLAAPAAPAVVDTAEGLTLGWDSPSLLASFATMAISDAAGGASAVVCQTCGAPFLTSAYQARYCSSRCKETARTRRRRAKDSD